MKKIRRSAVLVFLFLTTLVNGCVPIQTSIPPTPPLTASKISPTASPAPTVTPTNRPTITPIPTIETPPELTEFLSDVKILFYDPFNNADFWYLNGAYVNNGEMVMEGKSWWASAFSFNEVFTEGKGVMLKFKVKNANMHSEFTFTTGEFQKNGFRQFGIYNVSSPRSNLFQDKNNLGGNLLNGNLVIRPDTWYNLLMAIGKNGHFLAIMWDSDGRRVIYKETLGEKWTGKSYFFLPKADGGETLYADDFYQFSFGEIK